jgi:hypothetical protein
MSLLGGSLSAFYCPLLRIIQGSLRSVLSTYFAQYSRNNKLAQDGEARLYQNPDFLARYFCSDVFVPDKTLMLSKTVITTQKSHILMLCF